MTGTLNGRKVRLPFHSVYVVEDGKIARFVSTLDGGTIATWAEAIETAGGLDFGS